jgi:hypothetical protein
VTDRHDSARNAPLALRFILIASLALLLLTTVSEHYRTPPESQITSAPTDSYVVDALVIPGTRVGPVTLGLSTEQLKDALGEGQLRPQKKGTIHLYEQYALVVYSEERRVVAVTTRSPVFVTRNGIRVGDDVDAVLKSSTPSFEMEGSGTRYVLHDWQRGLHLGVEENRVSFLQVTAPLHRPAP